MVSWQEVARHPGGAAWDWRLAVRYCADAARVFPGNSVDVLANGDACFDAMLRAIGSATKFVHLETYIFELDTVGQQFAQELGRAAERGVQVRFIYDAYGSMPLGRDSLKALRESGAEILEYRPLEPWRNRAGRWTRRDHRKIMVVDGVIGFTGGINIGLDYASTDRGGGGWRDVHARVQGPAVAQLEALFRGTWQSEGGQPYALKPRNSLESVATSRTEGAYVLATGDGGLRSQIRRHYLHALRAAQHSIDIANAYFIPDRVLCRAIIRAAQRGVRVRLMLPGHSDVPVVQWASEHIYLKLLSSGVEILLWQPSHMHAKTVVVDDCWSMIGSYNLDYVSLFNNTEVVLVVLGKSTAGELRKGFEADLVGCEQLNEVAWGRRPVWRKVAAATLYRFRRWL